MRKFCIQEEIGKTKSRAKSQRHEGLEHVRKLIPAVDVADQSTSLEPAFSQIDGARAVYGDMLQGFQLSQNEAAETI